MDLKARMGAAPWLRREMRRTGKSGWKNNKNRSRLGTCSGSRAVVPDTSEGERECDLFLIFAYTKQTTCDSKAAQVLSTKLFTLIVIICSLVASCVCSPAATVQLTSLSNNNNFSNNIFPNNPVLSKFFGYVVIASNLTTSTTGAPVNKNITCDKSTPTPAPVLTTPVIFNLNSKSHLTSDILTMGADDNADRDQFYYNLFPPNFKWGVASSSYQVEGGWNADGKGETIWDRFTHSDPSRILDKSNGDVACDSYHKYKEDVKLVKDLGAKLYRISVSWARILPKGTTEVINQPGIDYYNKLIDALVAEGIEPVLTLYHWDLPQNLQELGGWQNEELIGIFGDYARICYQNFGDRVKHWVTINEPYVFCIHGYDDGSFAPGIKEPAMQPYLCVHTVLKAHAMAYHIYKEEFSVKQNGKVGIAADSWWYEPATDSPEDKEAAERALQFRLGWIMGPIFKGDYPPVMRKLIDGHSKLENRSESRLPYFSPDWSARLKGSSDFFGLNHYTTQLVSPSLPDSQHPSWSSDSETKRTVDPSWPGTGSQWLKVVPWGLRKLLVWIKNEYGSPEIIITENGCSDNGGLQDSQRVDYFRSYINEVLKAIKLDGCNVTGYFAWSLMDVFEWNAGYTEKFGLYSVDFKDPNRTRTPKMSVAAVRKIYSENGFPAPKLAASAPEHSSVGSELYCSTTVLCMALTFLMLGLLLAI